MPSAHTAAVILFWCQIIGATGPGFILAQWIWKRARSLGTGEITSFPMKYPRLLLALVGLSLLCGIVGLWLMFHFPKPVRCPPPPPIKQCPISAPAATSTTGGRLDQPRKPAKPPQLQGGTQVGKDNTQVTIGGSVKQGGDGGCQQNVIGGNNNTNTCAPPPTIHELLFQIKTTCTLLDPSSPPIESKNVMGVEDSHMLGSNRDEALQSTSDTYETASETDAVDVQNLVLKPDSELIGSLVSDLSNFARLKVVAFSASAREFSHCSEVEVTGRVNGEKFFHSTQPIAVSLKNREDVNFTMSLAGMTLPKK
jgi:hypothetical protein